MEPTKILPPNYALYRTLNLSKNFLVIVVLNVAALGLFILFGWMFARIAALLRPDMQLSATEVTLPGILILLGSYAGFMVLHELVHGLFFWLFTRERPKFGFRGVYAFAAAPDWYLPRNPYLWVGISPLVVISLAGIALIPFVPANLLLLLILNLTFNAAGAVGDIFVVAWLLTRPASSLVRDEGDRFSIYQAAGQ